jgi:hypothetical protein
MDYCGLNPSIPSAAVCFLGGPTASGGRWNKSCTGCDGVPRPDLQWFPAAASVNLGLGMGGVRVDACGVCGGNGEFDDPLVHFGVCIHSWNAHIGQATVRILSRMVLGARHLEVNLGVLQDLRVPGATEYRILG